MTFLTAMQPQLLESFTGRRVGEEMHLLARGRGADGKRIESKVRFHSITSTSFSWEQTSRRDDRDSWFLEAEIHAERCGLRANDAHGLFPQPAGAPDTPE
jgi:hypothetical protein